MFRKFKGENIENFVEYVKDYVTKRRNIQVIVATDSQNRGLQTVFATVITMHDVGEDGHGHGAHCIFEKWKTLRYPEVLNKERLRAEVRASIKTAKQLRMGGVNVFGIDVDVNPDESAGSNAIFNEAEGMVLWDGFNFRHKGIAPLTTTMADYIVKH
ncbi:MAG: hypothetical protein J6Y37_14190 [Paludibacteraceae bacterium]|nr:hypothetical protein [Paludibacteraceae bacterium]